MAYIERFDPLTDDEIAALLRQDVDTPVGIDGFDDNDSVLAEVVGALGLDRGAWAEAA